MDKLLITEHDVGELLSLGRSSVRKLMEQGLLPAVHVGRSLRFHKLDVIKLAQELRRNQNNGDGR